MSIASIVSIIGLCISLTSVLVAFCFNLKNSKKTDTREIEERVKENTRINMKLDSIGSDLKDIKTDIMSMRDEMKTHNDRIIKVEESAKQAHHRLDTIECRLNSMEGGDTNVR